MAANMYRVGGMFPTEGLSSHTSTTERVAGLSCSAAAARWALVAGQQQRGSRRLEQRGDQLQILGLQTG